MLVPLEESAVSGRPALVDGGHRLEPDDVVAERLRVLVTVDGVTRRRAGRERDVAAVQQAVLDDTGVELVVLDAVVVDERQIRARDREVLGAGPDPDPVPDVVDTRPSIVKSAFVKFTPPVWWNVDHGVDCGYVPMIRPPRQHPPEPPPNDTGQLSAWSHSTPKRVDAPSGPGRRR